MLKILMMIGLVSLYVLNTRDFDGEKQNHFQGNWTANYTCKKGHILSHTPQEVAWGTVKASKSLQMSKGCSVNGVYLPNTVHLDVNMNQKEFEEAARRGGIL